ncbi:MAG TPA: S41 family peptidase [Thermoanaerobaculia bacterium]|nr:S41 family peptidase [Thermoanaerobaculia bacterium]
MLAAFSLVLAALTVLLAAIVAASPRRPLPRWVALLAGALAVLMAGQALWSLRTSPLALLASVPLAAGVALLGLAAFPRRVRRPPGAPRRITAVLGIALAVAGAARWSELPPLPRPRHHAALLAAERTETDLAAFSWSHAFDALCARLAAEYPFTKWKGIDWAALDARFAPRIREAEARKDDRAYYRALRAFAWSIPDGHVDLRGDDRGLREAEAGGGFGLGLVELDDGRVMATRVDSGGPAERAGLKVGAEVLAWNGGPVRTALERVGVDWSEEPPATAAGRRLQQLRFLTHGRVSAHAAIGYRNPDAQGSSTAEMEAVPEEYPRPTGTRWDVFFGDPVSTKRLPDGTGYIKVKFELPTLWDLMPEREVRSAVRRFLKAGAPGIVIDVRGNTGGQDEIVPRTMAFFQPRPRIYEIAGLYDPETALFRPHPETAVRVLPREPYWPRKVAVLVDADTFSAGEGIPLALRGLPNVALFGWRGTQGSFGVGEKTVHLPDGLDFIFPQGQSLDGRLQIQIDSDAAGRGGVPPDHRVALNEAAFEAAFRRGRDVVLEAAVGWIHTPITAPTIPASPGRAASAAGSTP